MQGLRPGPVFWALERRSLGRKAGGLSYQQGGCAVIVLRWPRCVHWRHGSARGVEVDFREERVLSYACFKDCGSPPGKRGVGRELHFI